MKTTLVALTKKLNIVNDINKQKEDFEDSFLKSEASRKELHNMLIENC